MEKLGRDFFDRDTVEVARDLLGKILVRRVDGMILSGRITETEAYVGRMDKACHAYGYKRTPRTETLFARPGTAYIYLIYGMYHCLNFVTEGEGEPAAVLLRGLEPARGAEEMARRRFGKDLGALTPCQKKHFLDGPGKAWALLVHAHHNGGGLDDGIGRAADLESQLPDGSHGDGGGDDVAAADVDLHNAVDGAFLNGCDGAFELVSCAEFHGDTRSFQMES